MGPWRHQRAHDITNRGGSRRAFPCHWMHSTVPFGHLIYGIHTTQLGLSPMRMTLCSVLPRLEATTLTSNSIHTSVISWSFTPTNSTLPVVASTNHKRTMWSSGWSADFWNMQCGLIHALYYHVPFFIEEWDNVPWHYAANKDDHSNVTCSAGDTTCYFLPY